MIRLIEQGLYNRLAGDTALVAALGGPAIYPQLIPPHGRLPAVVYSLNRGGETHHTPRPEVDLTYLVKAVAETPGVAATLADLIRERLTEMALTSPWAAYRVQLTQVVSYVDQLDRNTYWHAGGLYRIRATDTS